LILLLGYLIGSFPTAIIAGKILKKIDIRDHGSGNAGATNVFRVLGWKAGTVVLIVDIFKGFASVWCVPDISDAVPEVKIYIQIFAGIAAIAGHIWTIFAKFRGGKGVGTAAGVFLGLQPGPVLICLLVFIGVVFKTRFVSLGSMIAAFLLPIILLVQKFMLNVDIQLPMIVLSIILALLIIITHKENINRLIQGTENKLTFGKSKEEN
ncbi:glycerol-3-phosphate 1-O-acyltransferase PlsY, partial [Calditrichota bacterium]